MYPSLFLSLSLFVALFLCISYAWEPRNVQAEVRQRMREIGQIQLCQTFPALGPIPPKYPDLMDLINSFATNISKLVQTEGTPSLTVNLIYDQDILWTQGYGLKNLSDPSSIPDGDTNYLIGSNTKLFTTLLTMIAQDKELLSITDEVSTYVPAFAPLNPFPSRRTISFEQLASHMAGMQRECPCDVAGNCNLSNEEMWALFQNVTLVNPPGYIPQYSNAGFAILGHAIEEIMEEDWAYLVQNEILGPLGMNNTGTNSSDENFMDDRAIGYTVNNTEAGLIQIGWESPAGSMYSSANDMAKFVSLFFRDDIPYMAQPNQILDSLSIREWRQPRYINNDLTGFGLPWEIVQSPIIYTKGGAIAGYLSLVLTVPQLKLGIVILQSSDEFATYLEVFQMWATSFIQPFTQILQDVSPAPVIPDNFSTFVGDYLFSNMTVSIRISQTSYYPVPTASVLGMTLPLDYYSENVFRIVTTRSLMTCQAQQDGTEEYIELIPSSPPSFMVPGLFPGVLATKIN